MPRHWILQQSMAYCEETHQGLLGEATQEFPCLLQMKGCRRGHHTGSGFTSEGSSKVSLKMQTWRKVLILAKDQLPDSELKRGQLISSCSRWTELGQLFWLQHILIQRKRTRISILWSVSMFAWGLEAVHEVKWLLTLNTDLSNICSLFLKENFHSHVLMGLAELTWTIQFWPFSLEFLWMIFMHMNLPVPSQRMLAGCKERSFLLCCVFLFSLR